MENDAHGNGQSGRPHSTFIIAIDVVAHETERNYKFFGAKIGRCPKYVR